MIFVDSSVKIMDGLREHVETDVLALFIRDEIKFQIDPKSSSLCITFEGFVNAMFLFSFQFSLQI